MCSALRAHLWLAAAWPLHHYLHRDQRGTRWYQMTPLCSPQVSMQLTWSYPEDCSLFLQALMPLQCTVLLHAPTVHSGFTPLPIP